MLVSESAPFRLLRQYPLLRALFMFTFRTRFEEIGIAFSSARGSIFYTGPLYSAAR